MNYNAPWKIEMSTDYMHEPDEEDMKHAYILCITDADSKTVLYTDSGYFKPRPDYCRLIAAAPELLAVLKEGVEFWSDEDGDNLYEWREKAKAVIKKAEGCSATSNTKRGGEQL